MAAYENAGFTSLSGLPKVAETSFCTNSRMQSINDLASRMTIQLSGSDRDINDNHFASNSTVKHVDEFGQVLLQELPPRTVHEYHDQYSSAEQIHSYDALSSSTPALQSVKITATNATVGPAGQQQWRSHFNGRDVARLQQYDEELKKRREVEEKQDKETEFLRSSIRRSAKLQALVKQKVSVEQTTASASSVEDGHSNTAFENSDDADGIAAYLQTMNSKQPPNRVHFNDKFPPTVSKNDYPDVHDVLDCLSKSPSPAAHELSDILTMPNVLAVLLTHNILAAECGSDSVTVSGNSLPGESMELMETVFEHRKQSSSCDDIEAQQIRIVRLMKDNDSPLGATVRCEGDSLIIGRVVKGGIAEKSGLLHEGYEVLEVNGIDLRGKTVNDVCDLVASMSGELSFVVVPSSMGVNINDNVQTTMKHVRAMYDYDPEDDIYLPCRELGLNFAKGDILHVISTDDPYWWQAYREGEDKIQTLPGLIPSASFQTQREQYNRELLAEAKAGKTCAGGSILCHKKRRTKSRTSSTGTDKVHTNDDEILTYEKVTLFLCRTGKKRPVVLIGPTNVGCLELRQKLLESDKDKFAGVVPHTNRPRKPGEVDGVHYKFISKQQFREDVASRKFVEWGEFQKYFYGTSFESVANVVERGKICILTLRAQSLRNVRNSQVMPYVVFIAPPSFERLRANKLKQNSSVKDDELRAIIQESKDIELNYGHYFDKVIVNYDLERAYQELRTVIYRLETEPQWVPINWPQNTCGGHVL